MKKICIALMLLLFLPSVSFGYMETKLFCSLSNKEIKISLNKADGSSCKAYIAYIEQTMRQTAKDLFTIQGYINKKQDADYRQPVKKDKLAMIDKLQGVRLNVIASMKTFESNLLKKAATYFVLKVTPYRIQLVKGLAKLSALTGTITPELQRYMTTMSGQIQTIDKIGQAETFEELIPLLNGYIYFKQKLEGKSD